MEDEQLQLWERLLEEQSALFRKTVDKNAELQARVAELEHELSVSKVALETNNQEKATLKKQVARLERNIVSLRDDNPIVLCLIDGDGNIFSPDLISQGRPGGSQAAQLLTKGITDFLAESEGDKDEQSSSISRRAQIWVSVYCNKSGLQDILASHQLCTVDQFEAFIRGFNQASPLFSVTDVGNGKEAADAKVKEYLRVFTRFPQTSKVFFGGGHDNGYASTLNSLNNEGLLGKIILLQGYKEVAFEVKALHLQSVEFAGVFLREKLPSKKSSDQPSAENDRRPSRNNVMTSPSKQKHKPRQPSDSSSNTKYDPPACPFYYLAICKAGATCRYGHSYELGARDLTALRVNAKKTPCGMANKDQTCSFGSHCPLGHSCPTGPKCKPFKAGRCKFSGKGMHDETGQDITIGSTSPDNLPTDPSASPNLAHSGVTPTPLDLNEVLDNAGESAVSPCELSPVPGSSAWFTKYYSPNRNKVTPADKDNVLSPPG